MATKQNSGLPRPRDSLLQLAANCFARAPAASGKGKGTRSVANPGVAKCGGPCKAGKSKGAPATALILEVRLRRDEIPERDS